MKITFEKNSIGCFTDENIRDYSVSIEDLYEAMFDEIGNGTMRSLHDVFADRLLWIAVPVTDEDETTVFEKVGALFTNDGECPLGIEADCPFKNGKMFDEFGRWWDIEDTDAAFTNEHEAENFTFFTNVKLAFTDKTAELVDKIVTLIVGIELFGLPDEPELLILLLEEVDEIKNQLDNITNALPAIDEILDGIGEE